MTVRRYRIRGYSMHHRNNIATLVYPWHISYYDFIHKRLRAAHICLPSVKSNVADPLASRSAGLNEVQMAVQWLELLKEECPDATVLILGSVPRQTNTTVSWHC